MKNRTNLAALRIALLLEEFSSEELAGALDLLGADQSDLRAFLRSRLSEAARLHGRRQKPKQAEGESEFVDRELALAGLDSERRKLLEQFLDLLDDPRVLTTLESVKRLGAAFRKDFVPGKSRKIALNRIVTLLRNEDAHTIRRVVEAVVASRSTGPRDDSFQRLAHGIMGTEARPHHRRSETQDDKPEHKPHR